LLGDAGRGLPSYLAGRTDLPRWLCDLAHLEWSRVDVFGAVDAPTLARSHLEQLAPADAPSPRLRLVPASAIVPIRFSVDELWAAIEDERGVPAPVPVTRAVLTWRRDRLVVHRTLEEDDAVLLLHLAAGTTFAELCEVLVTLVGEDDAVLRAGTLLLRWADAGILRRP
jgi:hypothetical protein